MDWKAWSPPLTTTRGRITAVIGGVAIVNFLVFFIAALALGGDAINGKYEAGHYFLNNKGRLTEVSEAVFTYSKWHTLSLFVTHPLAMLAGFFNYVVEKHWR